MERAKMRRRGRAHPPRPLGGVPYEIKTKHEQDASHGRQNGVVVKKLFHQRELRPAGARPAGGWQRGAAPSRRSRWGLPLRSGSAGRLDPCLGV